MSSADLNTSFMFDPKNKPKEIFLENFPGDKKLPDNALCLTYGFMQPELAEMATQARLEKKAVCNLTFQFDYGDSETPTPETLYKTRLLNLSKSNGSTALKHEVIAAWKGIIAKHPELISEIDSSYYKNNNYALIHPHLIGELLENEMFKHIEAVVYPVLYNGRGAQERISRVLLFSYDHIQVINKTHPGEFSIKLPDLNAPKQAPRPRM